jgi:glyoxylase-like metal-dependent hydrolase (beta-lactamase superfamily II)
MDGAVTLAPREAFEDRIVLDDAERPIEILHLGRANTDGDAIAWLPKQRVLVTGDIVVSPVPFGFGSYPADWIMALRKLSAMDFGVLVPGHGEPQGDRSYLLKLIGLLEEVRRQVGPLASQGLSLEEMRKKVDFSDHARTFVGDDPWMNLWFNDYWVTPITKSAFKEARGEAIEQGLGG